MICEARTGAPNIRPRSRLFVEEAMRTRTIVSILLAALALNAGVGRAQASSQLVETVQTDLYAGETAAAANAAEAALAASPADDEARFALGAVQFLQAIE